MGGRQCDLHALPTRRSSDLPSPEEELRLAMASVYSAFTWLQESLVQVMLPTVGDRKSTRLNSSHVAISYAVFCLNKKKNTQHTSPAYRSGWYRMRLHHSAHA